MMLAYDATVRNLCIDILSIQNISDQTWSWASAELVPSSFWRTFVHYRGHPAIEKFNIEIPEWNDIFAECPR
jgi:hypothetical protein